MTSDELLDGLLKIGAAKWFPRKIGDREMQVVLGPHNRSGQPSFVVIQWHGSPTPLAIFMGDFSIHPISRPLVIGNKYFKSSKVRMSACKLIELFLLEREA